MAAERKGKMTVAEAGHLGGLKGGKKGGEATKRKHGHPFYEEIGHKGGQKVRQLIKEAERRAL